MLKFGTGHLTHIGKSGVLFSKILSVFDDMPVLNEKMQEKPQNCRFSLFFLANLAKNQKLKKNFEKKYSRFVNYAKVVKKIDTSENSIQLSSFIYTKFPNLKMR